jgi:serine/threonine protein kinase
MDKYILNDSDVVEVLQQNNITVYYLSRLPRSGQRQVFEVTFKNGSSSIMKFVDITPYNTIQRSHWNDDFTEGEYEQELVYEIDSRSKRIIRELDAAKKCKILPQLEIFDEYKIYRKDNYQFIFYFETKFEGNTLDKSELYHKDQNIDAVINFLLQMAKQVKMMDNAGYVHRDLTPRNIIFYQNEFKIIDAGLVKSNDEDGLTGTEIMIGTPYFMAPEQAKRASDYIWDFRTDLFPLGIIAIQIFLPKTRLMQKEQIRDMHYIFPLWLSKDSSPLAVTLFSKVISRLAVEQRHRRWSSLDELIKILEALSH